MLSRPEGERVADVIQRESSDAELVLMGLQEPERGAEAAHGERVTALVGDLPTVILVHAAGPFVGQLLESTADADSPEAGAGALTTRSRG